MKRTIAYVDAAMSTLTNPEKGDTFVNATTGVTYIYDGERWVGGNNIPTAINFPIKNPEPTTAEPEVVKTPTKRTRKKKTAE